MSVLFLVLSLIRLLRLTSAPSSSDPSDTPERTRATDVVGRYNGDQIRMAEKIAELETDQYKTREKLRQANDRVKDLEGKLPPDGAVVLTKDDATLLESYRGLGKPDDLKTRLATGDMATQERDTLKRSNTIRTVADVAGYKAPVLERLGAELEYSVKDVQETVNGKPATVKRAFVVTDGTETPLTDYAAREWADFLPALTQQGSPEPPAPARGTPGGPTGTGQGTPAPAVSQADAQAAQAPLYRRF